VRIVVVLVYGMISGIIVMLGSTYIAFALLEVGRRMRATSGRNRWKKNFILPAEDMKEIERNTFERKKGKADVNGLPPDI